MGTWQKQMQSSSFASSKLYGHQESQLKRKYVLKQTHNLTKKEKEKKKEKIHCERQKIQQRIDILLPRIYNE